jgi:hypothetical protein
MKSPLRLGAAVAMFAVVAASAPASDVVVLKGGTVVALKSPVVRRGNTAYLTRADGTLLSVPVSEIDRDATAAANHAPAPAAPLSAPPAPSTPAEAARLPKDGQKAKVRITDADVSHPMDFTETDQKSKDKKEDTGIGVPRVVVADYTQEKNGATVTVKGTARNSGQGPAENVHMTVTAIDEKGQSIDGAVASFSKGTIDTGQTVEFNASLNIGERTIASLKFSPQWTAPPPPPAPAPRPGTAAAAAAAANKAPAPVPTPYGRGTLYAAPVANAPSQIPSDSHTGYIPGASNPDNQPKPPSR